jgi:opacity protein-like surface antigen
MNKLVMAAALLLMMPAMVPAQNADSPSRGQGYFFAGPVVADPRNACELTYQPNTYCEKRTGMTVGFGGEAFVHKGLGVGAEAAYAGRDWSFDKNGLGIGSIDASYHFFGKSRVEPFVVGGYSLYFGNRGSTQSGYNLGGGANFWLAQHAALRMEVRYQGNMRDFNGQFDHFVAFRFGVTFR